MSGLKQRIIGALVLISLAVIFVPMMFDEPHDERAVRSLDIPEEPPFPEVNVPEDEGALEGVPDYRVEEVQPPTPDVVEDPAMGEQGTVAGDGSAAPVEEPVPLVGEEEAPVEQPQADQPAPDSTTAAEPADTEAAPSEEEGESDSPLATASSGNNEESADFERTLAGAWVLQLGSFGNEDNARRLRDSVRERGYGAHLQQVTRGEQQLVRVFSGPFSEKAEAEKAKAVLDEAFGIKSLVTKGEG